MRVLSIFLFVQLLFNLNCVSGPLWAVERSTKERVLSKTSIFDQQAEKPHSFSLVDRVVLLEKFTSDHCRPCKSSSRSFRTVINRLPDFSEKVIMIRYAPHIGYSSYFGRDHLGESVDTQSKRFHDSRALFYSHRYWPMSFKDGQLIESQPHDVSDIYPSHYGKTPYVISLLYKDNKVTVHIENRGENQAKATVYAMIVEESYDYPSAPGRNRQTYFADSLLNFLGEVSLTASLEDRQQTIVYDLTNVTIPTITWKRRRRRGARVPTNFAFVTFIQKESNKEVLQAAKISLDYRKAN